MNWTQSGISGRKVSVSGSILCILLAVWQWDFLMMAKDIACARLARNHTVEGRVAQYGGPVRDRMAPFFEKAGVSWPARRITLVGLKEERQLEVWVEDGQGVMKLVRGYPVLGASGTRGPKLREGDGQVPEGVYGIESLNPNSAYHVSLRVDYPNAFDRARAREDRRDRLGGDIMIHGKTASAGCLAMGDKAAEDLFVMAALAGTQNVRVILAPYDFRRKAGVAPPGAPGWVAPLYQTIRANLPTAESGSGQDKRNETEPSKNET
jgi:hypothetical protein